MNVSMLLSVAMTTFSFIGYAHADFIPESTADVNLCNSWAETHRGTMMYEHAMRRCESLNFCMESRSDSEEELRECFLEAESHFLRNTSGDQAQGYQSPSGVATPVVTEVADSHYETKPGNKGWSNSRQE